MSTIKLTEQTKKKLKEINAGKYEDTINKLLKLYGGVVIDDIIEIERERTAFTLKYLDQESNKVKNKDITYEMLHNAKVGDIFTANENTESQNFINSGAEVIFKKTGDIVLFVEEVNVNGKDVDKISSIVHIHLF